jgi:ferric-dicitrate binding protein FerR (iron transport regulator)
VALLDGKLVYTAAKKTPNPSTDIVYHNQLATPRGRKYSITLPDGSKVWLNAVSTLRYPVQFTGNERRVQITGEAYFEIAPDSHKPFIVEAALPNNTGAEVHVLGTHFNVMAYHTEDAMKTTLLEGRIAIRPTTNGQRPTILSPGEQAQLTNNKISIYKEADLDQAIAWKNGLLSFDHADLKSVLRSVERWYDIDVVYTGDLPPRTFSGKVPSNANLSQLLLILEVNSIHYTLDGRVLTVKP